MQNVILAPRAIDVPVADPADAEVGLHVYCYVRRLRILFQALSQGTDLFCFVRPCVCQSADAIVLAYR